MAAFGFHSQASPAAHPAGPVQQTYQKTIESLHSLLFQFCKSNKIKANFRTPRQILYYLQALVSNVLHSESPSSEEDRSFEYWDRLRDHLLVQSDGSAGLLDRLFSCIEAVTATVQNREMSDHEASSFVRMSRAMSDDVLVLNTTGLACDLRGSRDKGPVHAGIVQIESLQVQTQLFTLLAGIARAAWRIKDWVNDENCPKTVTKSKNMEHWNDELGYFPFMYKKLFTISSASKGSPPHGLLGKIYLQSLCSFGEEDPMLLNCLKCKLYDSIKFSLLCTIDIRYSSTLGHLSDLPAHGVKGSEPKWCGKNAQLPAQVLLSFFFCHCLNVVEFVAASDSIAERSSPSSQCSYACAIAIESLICKGFDPSGSSWKAENCQIVSDSCLTPNIFSNDPQMVDTLEMYTKFLMQGFESISSLIAATWLLAGTEKFSDNADDKAWESEWEESYNKFYRETLMEVIPAMFYGVDYLKTNCASFYNRFLGEPQSSPQVKDLILGAVDEAFSSVLDGWNEYLLTEYLGNALDAYAGDINKISMSTRWRGLLMIVQEATACHEMRFRKENNFSNIAGFLGYHADAPQFVSIINISFALHRWIAGIDGIALPSHRSDFLNEVLLASIDQFCNRCESIGTQLQSLSFHPSSRVPAPRFLIEISRRLAFCWEYVESCVVIRDIEINFSNRLSRTLSAVSYVSAQQLLISKEFVSSQEDLARQGWREILANTLKSIGWYVHHAELSGSHDEAVALLEDIGGWTGSGQGQGLHERQLECDASQRGDNQGGFQRLLAQILHWELEDSTVTNRSPISFAVAALTERIYWASKMYFSGTGLKNQEIENAGGDTSVLEVAMTEGLTTNACVVLAKIEDTWSRPERQERCEWTIRSDESQSTWGWFTPYPVCAKQGSVAYHSVLPWVRLCVEIILPNVNRLYGVGTLEEALERNFTSYEEHSFMVFNYQRSKDALPWIARILKVTHAIFGEEVLLLSQLRAESFLRQRFPHMLQSGFVGCAGIQDRPDLHISLFRWLETDSGPCNNLLKLLDSLYRPAGTAWKAYNRGLDAIACSIISILERIILCRADPQVSCSDRNVEFACLYLAAPMVQSMLHSSPPIGLPTLLQSQHLSPKLPQAASRVLSLVCRLDLRPHTIRQSWEKREEEYQQALDNDSVAPGVEKGKVVKATEDSLTLQSDANDADCFYNGWTIEIVHGKGKMQSVRRIATYDGKSRQANLSKPWKQDLERPDASSHYKLTPPKNAHTRRELIDIATCHDEPVDTRVSILAFLSEALASQPGLADWLFDSDSESSKPANEPSSLAGCVKEVSDKSVTLDETAKQIDGYYNGWIIEIRSGKGYMQPAVVINAYEGLTRKATLSRCWDSKVEMPDRSSHYLLSKQLQLRRIIKAFLHPDVAFSGGSAISEQELNRLKVLEHSLMLIQTIWTCAPEERAGIVQGFSDPDCLIWGLSSPHHTEVYNKTGQRRSYKMRLHLSDGSRKCFQVFAAPEDPFIQEARAGSKLNNLTDEQVKKITLSPQKSDKVLGYLKGEEKSQGEQEVSFWETLQRLLQGGNDVLLQALKVDYVDDGTEGQLVRVRMPKALKRAPLPILDCSSKEGNPLIEFLTDAPVLSTLLREEACVHGDIARQMFSGLRYFLDPDVGADHVDRVRLELRIVDACIQEMEGRGYDMSEYVDNALSSMWNRLKFKLEFIDMDGHPAKNSEGKMKKFWNPVPLPYILFKYLYEAMLSSLAGARVEPIERLWRRPADLMETSLWQPLCVADAIESICRRSHIEALAVSICAMHVEDHSFDSSFAKTADEERRKLVQTVARRAVFELSNISSYHNPPQHFEVVADTSRRNQLDYDASSLKNEVLLHGMQRVSMNLRGSKESLTHSEKVEQKLQAMFDFSEDWYFDTKHARDVSSGQLEKVACGLNQDQAVHDLKCLLTISYCKFLQAAACRCPSELLHTLNEHDGLMLTRLLSALCNRLVMLNHMRGLSGDLEVKTEIGRTLSVIIHCRWPLYPQKHLAKAAGHLPAVKLLSKVTDALWMECKGKAEFVGTVAEQIESNEQRSLLYEVLVDASLRLLIHVQDMVTRDSVNLAISHDKSKNSEEETAGEVALLYDLVLVRLSSIVCERLQSGDLKGPVARKSCTLLAVIIRLCKWSDPVHWQSMLGQAFWTQTPGLFSWISGVSSQAISGGRMLDASELTSSKDAALDALAALEVITEVAQNQQGAQLLANFSFMLALRESPLHTKIVRWDAEQLRFYVGSGNSRVRNMWHQVWCQSLQAALLLSLKLKTREDFLHELIAFVVNYQERLTRVLTLALDLRRDVRAHRERSSGSDSSAINGAGFVHGTSSMQQEMQDVEMGKLPSLALLEEAKLWTAILLRLASKCTLWSSQVPKLMQLLLELIPEVVANLTDCLKLWRDDTSKFNQRFRPVSHEEQAQARMEATKSKDGQVWEEPSSQAKTVLDEQIRDAVLLLQFLHTGKKEETEILRQQGLLKYARQRCLFDQKLVDTLFVLIHNCLRIMCCFGDKISPYVDRTAQRFRSKEGDANLYSSSAFSSSSSSSSSLRCSLGTLTLATECSVSFLQFIIQLESQCDSHGPQMEEESGEFHAQVFALEHRRKMLMRICECCAILLGKLTADSDMRDSCFDLNTLKGTMIPQELPGELSVAVMSRRGEATGRTLRVKVPRHVEGSVKRTVIYMRTAMRAIFDCL